MCLSKALLTSLMISESDDKSVVTEMCKVQVGHMGILLLSSKNHIPSDNCTVCDTVVLAAVPKCVEKKSLNHPRDSKRTSWSCGALVQAFLPALLLKAVSQGRNPTNVLLTSPSSHGSRQVSAGCDTQHRAKHCTWKGFHWGGDFSDIFPCLKKGCLQGNFTVIRKNYFPNCDYLSCWHRFFPKLSYTHTNLTFDHTIVFLDSRIVRVKYPCLYWIGIHNIMNLCN